MLSQHGIPRERLLIVEHHEAHAAAALWAAGNKPGDTLVLTCDGYGDDLSATVSLSSDGSLRRIASTSAAHSIGQLYAHITFLLGMTPLQDEHKVMGLAPYAARQTAVVEPLKRRFHDLFDVASNGLSWRCSRSMLDGSDAIADLIRHERFDVIAAALQGFLEDFLETWVRAAVRVTRVRRIAVGGGVFMNVRANRRLLAMPEVDELTVLPSCGDETNCFGAAYVASGHAALPLEHLYLGPDITDRDVQDQMRDHSDLQWRRPDDAEREVAELLARGEVVARCAGPMEFGARALGNRSILADPSRPQMVRTINELIKGRDFWMPFAPAILWERADDYVVRPRAAERHT